jgi:hypothetical protein
MVDQDRLDTSIKDVVDDLGIPRAAVFQLESNQTHFLRYAGAGTKQVVPFELMTNNISDILSFDKTKKTITFQPGIYSITFTYEANHDYNYCAISSYFIDFPTSGSSVRRIHSTALHKGGKEAFHGGTITYTVKLATSVSWVPELGRGQSGNCSGPYMTLYAFSTQLSILKMPLN